MVLCGLRFKSADVCDRVVSGYRFRDVPLRVVSVDARSRLVTSVTALRKSRRRG